MAQPLHCPTCGAPLPPIEVQEVVACEFCETHVNAEAREERVEPARSPPLTPDGQRDDDPAYLGPGPFAHWVLSGEDRATQRARAQVENRQFHGSEGVTWLPALLDAVEAAEACGDVTTAAVLARHAYAMTSRNRWRTYRSTESDDRAPRSGVDLDRLQWNPWAEPRAVRIVLGRVGRRLSVGPGTAIDLLLLAGCGIAALKTLVSLAERAAAVADGVGLNRALESLRRLTVATTDPDRFAVLFDMHTWLIPRASKIVQRQLIDELADLADERIEDPPPGEPSDWRGPVDVLSVLLAFAEDLLHEQRDLGQLLLDRIVQLHHRANWQRATEFERWRRAVTSLQTHRARLAAAAAFQAIFGDVGTSDSDYSVVTPDLLAGLPPLTVEEGFGIRVARARLGQARCPGCGYPVVLEPNRLLARCSYCQSLSRIGREARLIKRKAHEGLAARLMERPPERLVSDLLTTTDAALRDAILEELAAATTDGGRYVALAPALVRYMVSAIPPEIERRLGEGFRRLLQHHDAAFLESLFAAIRSDAFTVDGSDQLLVSLEAAGPVAAPILLEIFDHATRAKEDWGAYASQAQQVAFGLMEQDFHGGPDFHTRIRWLLERMGTAGPMLAELIPPFIGFHVFQRSDPLDACHRTVLSFLDRATDPARVNYLEGLQPDRPDHRLPHYAWTAQDLDRAAAAAGYASWSDACARGAYHIQNLLSEIPARGTDGPTLRQVAMLASQVDSFWKGPFDAADLLARIDFLWELEHDAPRLLLLQSMLDPIPMPPSPEQSEAVERLTTLADSPILGRAATRLVSMLTAPR